MPPDAQSHDEVHVLDIEPRRRRLGPLLAVLGILALAGGGAWVYLTDPFAGGTLAAAPPPADDNLLGDAWSFETTATLSAAGAWIVPEEAPAGFAFDERGAVSGSTGASAIPNAAGWSRVLSTQSIRIPSPDDAVELSGTSNSDNVQLLLRFESADRTPLDVTVASGAGFIVGRLHPPPGATHVRAGIGAVGEGSIDDLELRFVDATRLPRMTRGVFEVVQLPHGLAIYEGDEVVFHLDGITVQQLDGTSLPAAAATMPGEGAVALADGTRLSCRLEVTADDRQITISGAVEDLPPGYRVINTGHVMGPLGGSPFGVGSERGYEIFTEDFRVENANALILGRTNDRLLLRGQGATISGTWHGEERVALSVEGPIDREEVGPLELQTSFQSERVEAAQLADKAVTAETEGRLGEALGTLELILTEYPYDESVLVEASVARGRIQAQMQEHLDRIASDLDDALFLASARRCREVLADCVAAAQRFAGSSAEERFVEMGRTVEQRAGELLEEDRARREGRVEAVMESFRAAGGYDLVVDELQVYIDTVLPPPTVGSESDS